MNSCLAGIRSHARLPVFALIAASALFSADAATYKWTGAVDSDFSDPLNWLVASGESWAATETPPANVYGEDIIVFEGEPTANMPELETSWKLHSIQFSSSGWTLSTGTNTLQLIHAYGGTYLGKGNGTAVTCSGGGTNTLLGNLWFNGGGYFSAGDGCTLVHDGVIISTSTGLNSNSKQVGFGGGGTLSLGGSASNADQVRFNMNAGTVIMKKTVGVAAGPLRMSGGLVVLNGNNQIAQTGGWHLSGYSSIDFGGFVQEVSVIGFGASPGTLTTSAPWTGSLMNAAKFKVGIENNGTESNHGRLTVNPSILEPVVFEGGFDSDNGRYAGAGCYFMVGDSTNEVEMIVDGALFPGNTGNNGTTLKIYGATADSVLSAGKVALTKATDWGGTYARLYLYAHLLANAQDGSSVGTLGVFEVHKPYGVLGGHGIVRTTSSSTPVSVFGTIAPGSPEQPDGTLTIGQSSANTPVVMQTNSTFRVAAAATGNCPKLQVYGPLTLGAESVVRIDGDHAPAFGVNHTIISHTGARTGEFNAQAIAEFPGAEGCEVKLSYFASGSGGDVILRVSPKGTVLSIK